MNRNLRSALAILVVCPAASANEETWASLDREIDTLQMQLAHPDSGPRIGGFLRIRGAYSSDADIDPAAGTQKLSGFTLDDVRIDVTGEPREGWSYRVSIEGGHQGALDTFSGSGIVLLDATATMDLGKKASVTVGQFCSNFLWSACNEERNLLFLDRTFLGENWDNRDVGAQVWATAGPFELWVAAQNGFDAKQDRAAYTARVACHAWGEGGWCCEGSCFGGGQRLTIGAAAFEDNSMDHGGAIAADVLFVDGRFSAHAEAVNYERDMRPMPTLDTETGAIVPGMMDPAGSDTPWDATIGYAFVPDAWEAAVRVQSLDDDMDTSVYSIALDRFIGGRAVKWTLQFDTSRSDDSNLEVDVFGLGLTVVM